MLSTYLSILPLCLPLLLLLRRLFLPPLSSPFLSGDRSAAGRPALVCVRVLLSGNPTRTCRWQVCADCIQVSEGIAGWPMGEGGCRGEFVTSPGTAPCMLSATDTSVYRVRPGHTLPSTARCELEYLLRVLQSTANASDSAAAALGFAGSPAPRPRPPPPPRPAFRLPPSPRRAPGSPRAPPCGPRRAGPAPPARCMPGAGARPAQPGAARGARPPIGARQAPLLGPRGRTRGCAPRSWRCPGRLGTRGCGGALQDGCACGAAAGPGGPVGSHRWGGGRTFRAW